MASIQIKVPDWLDRICVWPVMVYRRLKYGYSYRRIYLGEEKWTIVEPQDYYRFGNFKWFIRGNGCKFYALRSFIVGPMRTKMISLHREIMNAPAGLLVDHFNGKTLDNRKANLRLATHAQNTHNRQKTKSKTSSRFIGVCFDKSRGKWTAHIAYQKKLFNLGRFKDEVEAARTYDAAARKYHGEFARLNFPNLTAENAEKT
ncbi:MAG: AP2 domain-containing protein [Sedimentisphaerales bacterium]|nr:AP2 domain-containing protein [Sedimentisphaerales bacterium]